MEQSFCETFTAFKAAVTDCSRRETSWNNPSVQHTPVIGRTKLAARYNFFQLRDLYMWYKKEEGEAEEIIEEGRVFHIKTVDGRKEPSR